MCDSSTMSESDGSLYPAEDNVTVCGLCTFQPPDAPGPCQPIVLPCRRAFCRRCLASLLQATAAKCNDRCSERNNQDDGVDGKDKCRTVRDGQGNLPEVKTDTAILQSWKAQSVIPFRVGLKFIEATSTSPSTFHSSVAKRIHRIPPSTQRTDELNPVTNGRVVYEAISVNFLKDFFRTQATQSYHATAATYPRRDFAFDGGGSICDSCLEPREFLRTAKIRLS